jgi:hypothetical protein
VTAGVKATTEEVRDGPVQARAVAEHLPERVSQVTPTADDVAPLVLRRRRR